MYRTNMAPTEREIDIRNSMATAIADSWMSGERDRVRATIECAGTPSTIRQIKDDTAAVLPADQREEFLKFMRE